jgi:hypothetical protein
MVGEATPVGNGEKFWQAGNTCFEVILSSANCLFGKVGAIGVWRSVLERSCWD